MGHDTRLLVVHDEDAIRALLLTVLRRRGFQVDTAGNAAEAVEKLRGGGYAVVLLDLMMPTAGDDDFLEEIERLAAAERPAVIALTAGPRTRYLDPDLVAGTIRKPFDIELLADVVAQLLRKGGQGNRQWQMNQES